MDQLAQEYHLKVTYMSYYLRPDIPPEGHIRKLKAGEKAGGPLTGHIGDVADQAGLIMRRPRITPNTRMAFEASEYAKDMGRFQDFYKRNTQSIDQWKVRVERVPLDPVKSICEPLKVQRKPGAEPE